MAERFAEACGLDDDEARYFGDLVAFNQASGLAERNKHYAKLTGYQRYGEGDHAAGGHVVTALVVDTGRYCGIELPFERARATPIAGPSALSEQSVLIEGALEDGTAITIASALQHTLVLRTEVPFEMGEGAGNVLIGFDLAVWLGGLDWNEAARNEDGSISIDGTHNVELLAAFERALVEGTALFRDLDGSGSAIPAQRLARGVQ